MSKGKKKNIQYAPYILDAQPRSYAWCSCGESTKQPFCDGSHGAVGMSPKIVQITEAKKVSWCGCKLTGTPPFCDGTHSRIKD